MNLIRCFKDLFLGKAPLWAKRSSAWHKVRTEYLKEHPNCECCGSKEKMEVHHKKLFYLFPELELIGSNLMTLCEKRGCHLAMGHLYSYKSYNPDIDKDIKIWNEKVANRPKG